MSEFGANPCLLHSGMEEAVKAIRGDLKEIKDELKAQRSSKVSTALAFGFGIGMPVAGAVLYWVKVVVQ